MKWPIIGMFGLGLLAAICAGVLAASMQGDASGDEGEPVISDVTILLATRDMRAMETVSLDDFTTREVSPDIAPDGAFSDNVQVVGKVLIMDMTNGQVLTTSSFAPDGSNAHLAAALSGGRRAVNIPVNNSMGIEDLLYPGCFVDVLFSTDMRMGGMGTTQPVSVTLMQKVQVVAVGDKTIVEPDGPQLAEGEEAPRSLRQRAPRVTLLVDAKQAEALNLAMQEGSLSLALRNPNDDQEPSADGTLLASLLPFMSAPEQVVAAPYQDAPVAAEPERWETVIVRGGKRETKSFDIEDALPGGDG